MEGSVEPLEVAVVLLAPARSLSGLLWMGGAAPEAGGVTSMGSPVDWLEGGTEEARTGILRVLPGASIAVRISGLLDGGSARPLISRGGTGGEGGGRRRSRRRREGGGKREEEKRREKKRNENGAAEEGAAADGEKEKRERKESEAERRE